PRASCWGAFKGGFRPLPATRSEVVTIARLWEGSGGGTPESHRSERPEFMGAPRRATVLNGAAASEAAFKALAPDYDVVHVATHGFFLNASCEPAFELDRPPSGAAPAAPDVVTENPLVLAGLALAGVNRREIGQADQEDGVLTAEEIAALDLARVR